MPRRVYKRKPRARVYSRGAASTRRRAPRRRLTGRGDYSYSQPGPWGRVGRAVGRWVGSRYGMGGLGESLGGLAHFAGKAINGRGAYGWHVPNGSNSTRITQRLPAFSNGVDYIEVCRREYITDIISHPDANTFKIDNFPLQPGSQQTFPWLADLCATTFQSYEIVQCMFEFKSFSANALNSVNTALGTVVAAINYDSSDPVFTNRFEMENANWAMSSPPSDNFIAPVECARNQSFSGGHLYIRHSGVPAGADIKTYDHGRLSVATVGVQGTAVNLGSLYVNYKVRLYKPLVMKPLIQAFMYHARTLVATPTTITNNAIVGTNPTIVINNMNVVHDQTASPHQWTLDRSYLKEGMRFEIIYSFNTTGGEPTTMPSLTLPTGLAGVKVYSGQTEWLRSFKAGGGGVLIATIQVLYIGTLTNQDLLFESFSIAGCTPTNSDLIISQVHPGAQ